MTSKETKRQRVFVQVQSKFTGKWSNTKSAPTYEEALILMEKRKKKYPNATYRILDNNLFTHSK